MGLTDRQAARIYQEDAISKAYHDLRRYEQEAARQQGPLGLRNGMREVVGELIAKLIGIYSDIPAAVTSEGRNELISAITERVTAFVVHAPTPTTGDE